MNQASASRNVPRSIAAILAGMLTGIVLSLGTDELLHLAHVYPPWGASMTGYENTLLLATIYRTTYGVAGSYIAARLAPYRPMLHSMILGALGLAASIAGAVATWNGGPAFGPHWYPVALVVLALPTAWLGGKLRLAQLANLQAL
ncbi:MAG: hypothetical protein WA817_18450 [Candidatus Acidiferrum sp.]